MKGSLCKFCGGPIKWIKTANGKNMPLDPINIDEGDILYDRAKHTSHWDTCPKRDRARQHYPKDEGVLNAYLKTKLEEYVTAVKAGMGYEQLGKKFLAAVEKTHKPKDKDLFDDHPDNEVPF